MEYMTHEEAPFAQPETQILCCECGTPITPNPSNMCVACLRTKVDISEGICKSAQVTYCRFCERYLQPPNAWIPAQLESKELLTICLKRIKGLNKVRLVDAGFIWTEPHSKRLRVKLTIQAEVPSGAVLQQIVQVEFIVVNQMCDACHKVEAKDFWRAVVQVRQRVSHKKTLLYLEQLLLKHGFHRQANDIKVLSDGIDFFFGKQQDARRFVDFLNGVLPCRINTAQELVTHDCHTNVYDYKHTYCVEVVPICREDIVCLPRKLTQTLGGLGHIAVCVGVTNVLHLIDPLTLRIAEVSAATFFRWPFQALCTRKQLVEYTVLDADIVQTQQKKERSMFHVSKKHDLSEVWLSKSSEIGTENSEVSARTHLGRLLSPGDLALGFDLANSNVNDAELEKLEAADLPDVVLVKKVYDRSERLRSRNWKLRRLQALQERESIGDDYVEFMEDLEEDDLARKNVNIYKSTAIEAGAGELPTVSLQEMLDDLTLSDEEMNDV